MRPTLRSSLLAVAAASTAACESRTASAVPADTVANAAEGVATGTSTRAARHVVDVLGFQGPESVRYDPELDVFYVSNMTGYGSAKDGNGYITKVSAHDPNVASVLVQGGKGGAVLDAPKGMTLHGDTLWVADIDALRAFDRRTGAPLATRDFRPLGAVQLNDVALAPDGTLRVTDTGIGMTPKGVIHTGPDRIFSVGPGAAIATVDSGPQLRQPNGIAWDSAGRRWIVVSFDRFAGEVAAFAPDGRGRRVLHRAKGQLDGVVVLPDGALLYTSWADSSVHLLRGARDERLIRGVPEAADLGWDSRRRRVAVPLSTLGRVQLWELRGAGASPAAPR